VLSSPAVANDGTVFIGSAAGLLALNPQNGSQRWFFKTNEVLSTPSLGANNLVYFVSSSGTAFALDASSGALRWKTNLFDGFPPNAPCYSSLVSARDGTAFVGVGLSTFVGVGLSISAPGSFRALDVA